MKRKLLDKVSIKGFVIAVGVAVCLSACSKDNEPVATELTPTAEITTQEETAVTPVVTTGSETTPTPISTEAPDKTEDRNLFESNDNPLKRPNTIQEFNVTVELGQYKGLEIPYTVKKVSDEDIQAKLDVLREVYPDKKAIGDRTLEPGDTLRVDYQGYYQGIQYDEAMAYFAEITIPEAPVEYSFAYDFVGHKIGDDLEIKIIYPEDYQGKETLKGKEIDYKIHIRDAYDYVPAEVTDEFIQILTGYVNFDDYKAGTRAELEAEAESEAAKKAEETLMNTIIDGCTYSGQIDEELDYMYGKYITYNDDYAYEMMYDSGAQYFSMVNDITEEEYYNQARKTSDRNTKFDRALLAIAKAEGLSCSDEEMIAAGQALFAENYSTDSKAKLYKDFTKEEIDRILTESVLKEKAFELVRENTIYTGK
ncbi:MAG: hypothetical protein IKW90_05280 [Lachnospiraceae bacterium]|nr:hypothetical protein [Lachnospiraceae bacterium]